MCFNRNMSIDLLEEIRSDDAVLSMDFSIAASRIFLMSSLSSSLTYSATFFSRRASGLGGGGEVESGGGEGEDEGQGGGTVRARARAKAAAVRAAARRKAPRARREVAAARAKTGATRGTVARQ